MTPRSFPAPTSSSDPTSAIPKSRTSSSSRAVPTPRIAPKTRRKHLILKEGWRLMKKWVEGILGTLVLLGSRRVSSRVNK
ncbi:hypothetical protein glysoja_040034 [Glycine soja]|uniref:Uncharacterized protein n=1 Tax=Glycine soja TaxID=3848 RepID=A0A0B2NPJ2_GLYSO|nr:hypothetical protein glysoja_040034 [Glycine soja]